MVIEGSRGRVECDEIDGSRATKKVWSRDNGVGGYWRRGNHCTIIQRCPFNLETPSSCVVLNYYCTYPHETDLDAMGGDSTKSSSYSTVPLQLIITIKRGGGEISQTL